jgi:hypothetical protein
MVIRFFLANIFRSLRKKIIVLEGIFSHLPPSTTHPPTPPPQEGGLDGNVEAAIAHRGKWMGEGGVSGLASFEFEILVSIFFTSTSTRGADASVENRDFHAFPRDGCRCRKGARPVRDSSRKGAVFYTVPGK